MKPIIHWIKEYLENLPPRTSYSFTPGGIKGGECHISLDVYGTADTPKGNQQLKTGRQPVKRSPLEIEKSLQYMREHPPFPTKNPHPMFAKRTRKRRLL